MWKCIDYSKMFLVVFFHFVTFNHTFFFSLREIDPGTLLIQASDSATEVHASFCCFVCFVTSSH